MRRRGTERRPTRHDIAPGPRADRHRGHRLPTRRGTSPPPTTSGRSCWPVAALSVEVPAERWEPYLHRDPRNAAVLRETTRWGTFLDDLPGFDAEFFGVSPREAELMDPQQRLALEVSWEALEHAGISPRSLAGTDTAVLMGVNSDDYGKLLMEDLAGIEAWTGIGTSLCGVANRVSHLLDLRGPSVALDAACAASLVAVHQACQLLRDGETSLALAGGVSALIGPGLTRVLDVAGATAPDGRCKTFDDAADGYGRGEGAGRRRAQAARRRAARRRPGVRGRARRRGGTGRPHRRHHVAQRGGAGGSVPARVPGRGGAAGQRRLSSRRTEPALPTGDPVEVAALSAVYGAGRAADPCAIGSVKPNTGHLEGGAGVVGLIKATLALHHEVMPPTAGVRTLTHRGGLGFQRAAGAHRSGALAARCRPAARCGVQLRLRRHHRPCSSRRGTAGAHPGTSRSRGHLSQSSGRSDARLAAAGRRAGRPSAGRG